MAPLSFPAGAASGNCVSAPAAAGAAGCAFCPCARNVENPTAETTIAANSRRFTVSSSAGHAGRRSVVTRSESRLHALLNPRAQEVGDLLAVVLEHGHMAVAMDAPVLQEHMFGL